MVYSSEYVAKDSRPAIGKSHYSVVTVLCCGYLLCYMDRMAIAIAIPFIAKDLQLSPLAMGGVMSAFFLGYSVMQIPGGLLADRFGSNRVMTVSILCWSVFTAMTGAANSLLALVTIRILFGLSEGPYPPAASKTVALWFPEDQVGRVNGAQLASVNVGAAIAPLILTPIIVIWGWRTVFYILLVPGLLAALIIWVFIKDPPVAVGALLDKDPHRLQVSFTQALKMSAVRWCCVALFLGNVGAWGLMNWLPTYLLQARELSVMKTGAFSSLPFLAGALGYFLGGYVSDKYFRHKRYIPIVFGFLLSGLMTYVAAMAPTGEAAVVALVVVFLGLFAALGGIFTLPLVLVSKNAVGAVFGVVNTFGQAGALLSPLIVGYILSSSGNDFVLVFNLLVVLFIAAAAIATRIKHPAPRAVTQAVSGIS